MIKPVLPELFISRLKEINPALSPEIFKARAVQAFRINTLKISILQVLELLAQKGVSFQKIPWCEYVVLVEKSKLDLFEDLLEQGILYAQGLQSLLPVMALDPKPGQKILDLCAAPGSKTTQIAMLMNNTGSLFANEPIKDRFYRLKSVVNLMGAVVNLSMLDGRRFQVREGLFDGILVDAPCSSEGRFCVDKPKSIAFWSERKIKEMAHKQKGLLLSASRLLRPGGVLVYATCTFAPEENEGVLDWFLRKTSGEFSVESLSFTDVKISPSLLEWKERSFNPQVARAVRVCPDERMEGFFIAKLRKSDYK